MNILVITHEYPPIGGGGGVFAKDLCESWTSQGHNVFVVTSKANKTNKSKEKINKVKIYRVWSKARKDKNKASFLNLLFFLFFGFFKSIKVIQNNKINFINSHFALPAGMIGYLLSFIYSNKQILSIHGADIYDPSRRMSGHKYFITRFFISRAINRADATIASTADIRNRAKKYFNLKTKIQTIPLGFKPNPYLKNPKIKKLKNKTIKIIAVARLVKRKNLNYLIRSVKKIKKVELRIIGSGPELKTLKRLVRKLNIKKKVKFYGFVDEEKKAKLLNNSHIFILPSLHEGFGIVFLEAMQAGLPIITSNEGGQIYFLKNKVNAIFVEIRKKEDLKNKTKFLIDRPELLENISKDNLNLVKKFNISIISKRYLKLFKTIN